MKKTLLLNLVIMCLMLGTSWGQHNYGDALQKSMFFYEAQQAGQLSPNNRVSWRANSTMKDGKDVGIDLSKGWYDAGDHVKFNFPMAYSVTTLCWGYLENKHAYEKADQVNIFKENIKYVTDYFINCHPSPNELYGQVGDGNEDHKYWLSAEVIDIKSTRKSYKIDASKPGSDLAGETAAALAAASIVFKDSDPTYSELLLKHAKELYTFADTYRGKYSESISNVKAFYNSWSGYQDELCWGAIWLYKATQNDSYLTKAKSEYDKLGNQGQESVKSYGWTLAWDDKSYGCYVLMAALTGDSKYSADAERHLNQWFTDRVSSVGPKFTQTGFPVLDMWGSFRYAANTAFLMLEQSDNMSDATKQAKYRKRAKEIMDYLLGDNPQKTSYVIGYGAKYPLNPHHRTAHGSWSDNISSPVTSRHILYGALVGGHEEADDYNWEDNRSDYEKAEVACDYNSLFTGVAARLYADYGGDAEVNFPLKETPNGEFLVEAKLNASGTTFSEYAVWVYNRTAWPARVPSSFKFKIYVDISEGISAGYSASDYVVSSNNADKVDFSNLVAYDASKGIYYTEVSFKSGEVIYPGGQSESKREAQVRIRLPYEASASAWDVSNDWSATGVNSSLKEVSNIPLYVDGALVFGNEPGPVVPVDVTGVAVSSNTLTINKGKTSKLVATVQPSNASNKEVTWTSSNEAIATVSNEGVVTAIKEGSATITVTTKDGSFKAVCEVTVTDVVVPTYTLTTSVIGNGTISVSPDKLKYDEGSEVVLTAIPESGYVFTKWSGDASGSTKSITITIGKNTSVEATFEESTTPGDVTIISLPFKFSGTGEYFWETTEDIASINSWSDDKVEVNGVDYTNRWSNQLPAKVDGKYKIHFVSSVDWGSVVIEAASKNRSNVSADVQKQMHLEIKLFPNPTSVNQQVHIKNIENCKTIKVYSMAGQKMLEKSVLGETETVLSLSRFTPGSYVVKVTDVEGLSSSKILIVK
ncbi:hypothetical protein BZG02_14600 [Labilibaculum filiforme]|uniref:Endoglucanase n=1 Tax=Labilibaculum filiforme TaxID=1940526 RepID=A0A2N3HUX1_9BACT|nr:glycoside hydrolase family 9 protein [Labilibaculum filiforme]PKQ61852.1 hypothetical protein BZG02_14600 [Labilibaculum filiforme]